MADQQAAMPAERRWSLRARSRTLWGDAARRLWRKPFAMAGLIVVALFVCAALLGPYVAPYDFLKQDVDEALQGPSAQHWLGTDPQGRDIFSRLLYGARTAAIVAGTTTTVSLLVGLTLGTMAAFMGRRVDATTMWVTDIAMSIPDILLAMLVSTALRRPVVSWFDSMYQQTRNPFFLNTLWLDFVLVFGVLALISWPRYARLVRGQVLSIRKAPYVEAARAAGLTKARIMRRHVLPNAMGPVVVAVTQGVSVAILLESSLSFLGIGVQPPNASWGSMLADSLSLWRVYPHLLVAPAATLALIQVAFVLLGDGVNDALNPRQANRRRGRNGG